MKATRISFKKLNFILASNEELLVILDVWKIPPPEDQNFPDGFKFSFIAFKADNPNEKILLDCHPPKGPHMHINNDELSFEWSGIESATELFWEKVENKFGKLR
jgi:hypothetical protein